MRTDENTFANWGKEWCWKLKERHQYKYVQLSLWSMPEKKLRSSTLIGCMCFTVDKSNAVSTKNLIQYYRQEPQPDLLCSYLGPQPDIFVIAEGWFYLLHRALGCSKHLRVVEDRLTFAEQDQITTTSTNMSRAIFSVEGCAELTTLSSHCGYGIKLTGHGPVRICRVVFNSAAHSAGLEVDDCIMAVNDVDVTEVDAITVSTMIKRAKQPIRIVYQRHPMLPIRSFEQSPTKYVVKRTTPNCTPATGHANCSRYLSPIIESPNITTNTSRSLFSDIPTTSLKNTSAPLRLNQSCHIPKNTELATDMYSPSSCDVFNKSCPLLHRSQHDLSDFVPTIRSDD